MGRIYRQHHAATILTEQLRYRQFVEKKAQQNVKTLAAELISRIGVDEYEAWIDNAVDDDDKPTDIKQKMIAKLEALDHHDAHKDEIPA